MADEASVQRLLVLGSGYSGTTLLAMGLATSPEVLAVGELPMLAVAREHRDVCTCGSTFAACPLWSALFSPGVGGLPASASGRSAALGVAIHRLRERVAAIAPEARWMIDSGKTAQGGLQAHLSLGQGDLRAIHLVRHPAAVVHSSLWRGVALDEAVERWIAVQSATIAALATASIPTRRLRYEDLASDFAAALSTFGAWLGIAGPFGERGTLWRWQQASWTQRSHIMASNPRRFEGRPERIAVEEGFRYALGPEVVRDIVQRAGELAQQLGYDE